MATAALIVVGSEMLDPDRRDADGPVARQGLAELGIPLVFNARVEDTTTSIAAAAKAALAMADILIFSGGLGPTGDDLTRDGAALALGRGVVEDPTWAAALEQRLVSRGRPFSAINRRQALIVEGAEMLPNPRGLACGSLVEQGGKVVALLPGPPREFSAMFAEELAPRLARRFPNRPLVRVVHAVATGLPEADAEPTLLPWYQRPGVAVSILPMSGVLKITFTITAPPAENADALADEARAALSAGLGPYLVSLDGRLAEEVLAEKLLARGWSLAAAESCTGGSAARKIVSVPGASRYFRGGIEAYANEVKERLLGVPAEILARHGAVSAECAAAMAEGARRAIGADCAVATTGVAGPDGGTPTKPVGLVYVAASTPERTETRKLSLNVDRPTLMDLAANYALHQLLTLLR